MTMMSMRTLNNAVDGKEDMLKEDTMTEEENFQILASIAPSRQTAVDQDHHRHQFLSNDEHHQSSEWRGKQGLPEMGSDGFEDDVCVDLFFLLFLFRSN